MKSFLPSDFWSAKRKGQWSVETTDSVPSSSAFHSEAWWCFCSQRRGEHVLGLFPALARHLFFERKHQVLRASLRQRMQAALLRMLELAQRVLVGKMHDVHGRVRHMCDGNGAVRGLSLCVRRTAVRVKVRRGLALGDHPRHHDVDHAAILRVHAAERVQLSRPCA